MKKTMDRLQLEMKAANRSYLMNVCPRTYIRAWAAIHRRNQEQCRIAIEERKAKPLDATANTMVSSARNRLLMSESHLTGARMVMLLLDYE